ncbi:MAG: DUF6551 family protein [Reyranellaceae bacterium]
MSYGLAPPSIVSTESLERPSREPIVVTSLRYQLRKGAPLSVLQRIAGGDAELRRLAKQWSLEVPAPPVPVDGPQAEARLAAIDTTRPDATPAGAVVAIGSGATAGETAPVPDPPAVGATRQEEAPVTKRKAKRTQDASQDLGQAPALQWIDVGDLVVDRRYQRVMGEKNEKHVRAIVRNFSWLHYQPIIVARTDTGYAVIDGQHRYEAAKKHPLVESLPCYVIEAPDVATQATVFISANSARIQVMRIHKFWAAHAAGEAWAVRIVRLCEAAGVEIARGPVARPVPPLTTMATYTLEKLLPLGDDALGTALRVLARAQPDTPDVFRSATIAALTRIVAGAIDFDEETAVAVVADFDLPAEIGKAHVERASNGGRIEQALEAILRRRFAAAARRRAA